MQEQILIKYQEVAGLRAYCSIQPQVLPIFFYFSLFPLHPPLPPWLDFFFFLNFYWPYSLFAMLCQFRCTIKYISYTGTCIHSFFIDSFPIQSIEQSSLCYTVGSCQLPFLYIVMCMCQCHSPNPSPIHPLCVCVSESRSVVSDSLQSHEQYSPWNSPGQNNGVGNLSLIQGIFPWIHPLKGSTPYPLVTLSLLSSSRILLLSCKCE